METDAIRQVYSTFFHRATHGTAVLNRQAVILQANEALSRLIGIPAEKLIGTSLYSFVHPEDRTREREELRAFLASERLELTYETRWLLSGRAPFPVRITLTRIHPGQTEPSWVVASFREKREPQKTGEPAFSRKRRTAVPEQTALNGGYWEWDEEVVPHLKVSSGMYAVLGMTRQPVPLTEEQLFPFVYPEDREKFARISTGNSFSALFRLKRQDGAIRYLQVTGSPATGEEGAPTYWAGSFADVTELKLLKKKLHQQQRLTNLIHNTFHDIICTVKPDCRIGSLSPSFYVLSGYTEEEMKSIPVQDLIPPEDIRLLRSHMDNSDSDVSRPVSFRCRTRDGGVLWLEAVITPVPDDLDQPGSYIIVARDQTEKMNIHEQAVNSDKLTAAGGLAAGIAHEIRNPLTAIRGFIQLMKNGTVKEEFHDIILSELSRIDTIIRELLILSKPHEISFTQTDLYSMLDHVVTLINTQAILHGVEIEQICGTEPVQLHCDVNQIKQVLINLLKNAIEAMPGGGRITVETHPAGAKSVQILIKDQGVGISPEDLEKIGQMFYTTKESGTGLGMMISHEIIRNHGGRMSLRSAQGVGTTVEIILPLAK
ncbi:PAS domain S-box protein [Gorillibacterium sp. sgz500922]|uniref:PAS domain S-box protein n=1 Tax=Gorillibacterium sp. sgz500922 TaxID=3446694 RepID=UPI003F6634E2